MLLGQVGGRFRFEREGLGDAIRLLNGSGYSDSRTSPFFSELGRGVGVELAASTYELHRLVPSLGGRADVAAPAARPQRAGAVLWDGAWNFGKGLAHAKQVALSMYIQQYPQPLRCAHGVPP